MKPTLTIPGDRAHRRGSALIVVLWVIVLMSIMVASLAFDSHVEGRITQYYRNRTKAYYLAVSGLEVARMLMIKQADIKGPDDEGEEDDRWFDMAKRLKDGLAINGLEEELGAGTITLDIVPEPARRNINQLGKTDVQKEENLERILEVGGIPEEMWPQLIESFLDWIDADGVPRVDGAETEDYYDTLDEPYEAKNGPLDTVDELLLIKGFTREILSGGFIEGEFASPDGIIEEDGIYVSGIDDLLTVYGTDKINVNAAPMRVLMTLPGMDEVIAGVIIEEREGELLPEEEREADPFTHVNDVYARIPEVDPTARAYLSIDAGVYRITSVGMVGGVEKVIWCIAEYANEKLTILRWREED